MNKQATSVFDTWAETGLAEGMEEEHAGTVVEAMRLMELRSKETVLDLGSGNGWATRILADITGGPTIGVDGAANMIERATGMSKVYDDISFIHALF